MFRICFECGKAKVQAKKTQVKGEVRGEALAVDCEAMVCLNCGAIDLTEKQSDAYNVAVTDAYKSKHGLLTSVELKASRKRVGMSQSEFAKYLRVGPASVKRWELGLIQDEAMDELIRLKTDPEAARKNHLAVVMHDDSIRETVVLRLAGAPATRETRSQYTVHLDTPPLFACVGDIGCEYGA